MSLGTDALAEAFDALQSVHGKTWTFGAATFTGVAGTFKPDDPRMQGASDRIFPVMVNPSELPTPAPVRGSELVMGGKYYRVVREPENDPASGLTTLTVAPQ